MQLSIEAIGRVKSPVGDAAAADTGWSQVVSEIHVNEAFAPGLKGLEDWSHVVVIFQMHEAEFDPDEHLVFRPGGREDVPEVGVFAQRSRFHPSSIGLTAVKVLDVTGNIVKVRGLDAIDGTPVLAIKPYAPVFDDAYDPAVPVWFVRLMQG
jgi:tRNA-Thr(GGU) m(6)t(6)A37 methyltransferase TsaA